MGPPERARAVPLLRMGPAEARPAGDRASSSPSLPSLGRWRASRPTHSQYAMHSVKGRWATRKNPVGGRPLVERQLGLAAAAGAPQAQVLVRFEARLAAGGGPRQEAGLEEVGLDHVGQRIDLLLQRRGQRLDADRTTIVAGDDRLQHLAV